MMDEPQLLEHPLGYVPMFAVGKGSYGTVYKAKRPALNTETRDPISDENGKPVLEEVAIKKIEDFGCIDRYSGMDFKTKYLRRICREVDILLHFRCVPQMVETKEVYLSKDKRDLHIVMSFVQWSLDKVLALKPEIRKGMTENHMRWIIVQILLGLEAMHKAGCMHRDLSLGNVLIDPTTMDCCLADFGLSRVQFEAKQDISLDVVSLPFRAPEILLEDKKYRHNVDVWSMGMVMMELFLNKPFCRGKDVNYQLLAIIQLFAGFPDISAWEDHASRRAIQYFSKMKDSADASGKTLPAPKDVGQFLIAAGFSEEAADVARKMLVFDPRKRPGVEEVLNMPWFQKDERCKEMIDSTREFTKDLTRCPSEIETMEYDQLVEHMQKCCTPGLEPNEKANVPWNLKQQE